MDDVETLLEEDPLSLKNKLKVLIGDIVLGVFRENSLFMDESQDLFYIRIEDSLVSGARGFHVECSIVASESILQSVFNSIIDEVVDKGLDKVVISVHVNSNTWVHSY